MDDFGREIQNVTDKAVVDCVRNEIILREIFGNLSSSELLQLSIVNKLWNHEARSLMRYRGNVLASISGTELCVQVENFGSALESMKVIPFSALKIWIPKNFKHAEACRCKELREINPTSFRRLSTLRSVYLSLEGPWWDYDNCPAFQLAKVYVQRFSGSLERLMLEIDLRQEDFIRQVFHETDCNFLHLRWLSLAEGYDDLSGISYATFVWQIVSRVRNLDGLYIEKLDQYTGRALKGCSATMIYVFAEVSAPFQDIPEDRVQAFSLRSVVFIYTGPEFNFVRFNRLAPALLQASRSSLCCLKACPILLPSLMAYSFQLQNVTEFEIRINFSELAISEPSILDIFKNFNFTHIFPNLKKATINRSHVFSGPLPHQINRMVHEVEAVMIEPQPDRADNIRELILNHGLFGDDPDFWAEMFPNIQVLRLGKNEEDTHSEDFPVDLILEVWPDLKELEVSLRDMRGIYQSADSALCGIFPAECGHLRIMDDEYLKRVHIVPVIPSITCFRNLKTLIVNYYSGSYIQQLAQPELFKLTRFIAFERCSTSVVIKTHYTAVYEALSHMKPYASVVLE